MRRIGLVGGLVAFLALLLAPLPLPPAARGAAAVAALMAVWWLSEAISIYRTSLLPLLLFPALGVFGEGLGRNVREAARPYFDEYIFLFMGGMTIGAAMERWSLHRRIALHILRAVGTRGDRLILGFLLATAFVSLWISNTATAVMMMPIGLAVIRQLEAERGGRLAHFGAAVMLAVAYGANIGGIGTKIGTAPNSIFCGYASERLGRDVSFLEWMGIGLPFVVSLLPIAWWLLARVGRPDGLAEARGREVLARELAALGPVTSGERRVAGVFAVAAALWIAGQPLARALGLPGKTYEASVAMSAALALFVTGTLDVRSAARVPWETLLLLGGGFSMAAGVEGSGLSKAIAGPLGQVAGTPGWTQMLVASGLAVAVSAVASNVATLLVLLPILSSATGASAPVLAVATIACSCDFMLPAGTPPNAIVFGSGYLTIPQMVRVGAALDLAAALLAAAWGEVGLRRWL
ncbi:MAG: SLC13/DASS family transporter [Planctomycetes bacterium]|nr:SLC13/DASS family transporter [Planctomycetota bacterium]